jgi:hypothetical protein
MSDSPELAQKATAAKSGGGESEGGMSMAPPALQLMAAGEGAPSGNGNKPAAQLKAPAFNLSAGPLQAKVAQLVASPVMDPINYITGEMTTNVGGPDAAYIRAEFAAASTWNPIAKAEHTYNAYKRWYDLVRTGGVWDHKSHLRTTYGNWADDAGTSTSYFFDTWSNIHYGYIGASCGFSQWMLLSGAGAAQVMAGTVPDGYWSRRFQTLGDADFMGAFDDPKDQQAIRVGISLFNSFGSTLTGTNVLAAVRGSAASLSTRPMAAPSAGAGTP